MTETNDLCPVCGSQLEPSTAKRIIELYEATLLTSEAYRAAFKGAAAATRNNVSEYEIQSKKLDRHVDRILEIYAKYETS